MSNTAITSLSDGCLAADLLVQEEYDALKAIYDSTNGPQWTWSNASHGVPWDFSDYSSSNPCSEEGWQGLECGNTTDSCGTDGCHLLSMNLTGYNLSGSLPALDSFSLLRYLYLSENSLTGLLPAVSGMPEVQIMNFSYNSFQGQLPDTFQGLISLYLLYLSNNAFSGTIPPSMYSMPSLQYLSIYNNSIAGTVGEEVGSLAEALYLNFAHNLLHGQLPATLFTMVNLTQVLFSYNAFTGPLPEEYSENLVVFRVSNNALSGTVPSALCASSRLQFISIYDNRFHGQLPACFSQLSQLMILLVQTNRLSGRLDAVFNASVQKQLQMVDVSGNAFSGTLPDELLRLPTLVSVAAGENCFHGTIPASMCESGNLLTTVALDGLAASSSCVDELWDPFDVSQAEFGGLMQGTIPSCLWALPNISVLHLSANGLTGSLSDIDCDRLSRSLTDVVLTHNKLTGTIPSCLQQYPFSTLDLSYNKLKGRIEDMTNFTLAYSPTDEGTSLSLEFNRLSGELPMEFLDAFNIDILRGNLFACRKSGQLVKHDPGSQTAVCGSQQLNGALTTFFAYVAAILGLALVGSVGNVILRRNHDRILKAWHALVYAVRYSHEVSNYPIPTAEELEAMRNVSGKNNYDLRIRQYHNVYQFLASLSLIQRISWLVAGYSLTICLPTYITFYLVDHNKYSTHTNRYGWIASAAFLTGELPASVLFVLWTVLIMLILHLIVRHFNLYPAEDEGLVRNIMKMLRASIHHGSSGLSNPMLGDYAVIQEEADEEEQDIGFSIMHEHEDHHTAPMKQFPAADGHRPVRSDHAHFAAEADDHGHHDHHDNSYRYSDSAKQLAARKSVFGRSFLSSFSDRIPMLHADEPELEALERRQYWINTCKYLSVFFINMAVSICINASYLLTQNDEDIASNTKIAIQVLMAGFKIFWNIVCLRMLMTQLPYKRASVMLHVFMLIFNSIFAPCIATAFTDNACFRECFIAPNSISVSYHLTTCIESYQEYDSVLNQVQTVCTHYQDSMLDTTFTPTMIYYYTCGSRLLTIYTPVYMYIYTMLLTLFPLAYAFLASSKTEHWPAWLITHVDGALRPNDRGKIVFEKLMRSTSMQAIMISHIVVLLTFGVCCPLLGLVIAMSLTVDTLVWQLVLTRYIKYGSKDTPFSPHYQAKQVSPDGGMGASQSLVDLLRKSEEMQTQPTDAPESASLSYLAPTPTSSGNLGLLKNGSTDSLKHCESDIMFRLLYSHYHTPHDERYEEQIREEARLYELHTVCGEAWKSIRSVMWVVMYCTIFFWSCVLFDMAGDATGWKHAMWMLIAGFLLAVVLRVLFVEMMKFVYERFVGGHIFRKVQVRGDL